MEALLTLAFLSFLAMAWIVQSRVKEIATGAHAGDAGRPLSTFFVPWSEHLKHKGELGFHASLDAAVHGSHLASLWLARHLYRFSQFVKGRRDLMRARRDTQTPA